MKTVKSHRRVNDILLGPIERPLLRWFSPLMPAWVTPDLLTGVGVFGAFLSLIGYSLTNFDKGFLWLASLGFIINWFGDSMDGTLARYRKIERPKFGFFVDHSMDALSQLMVLMGLGASPLARFDTACLVLIGYLLMDVVVITATYVTGTFKISFGKLGPTEIRAIAILLNTYLFFGPNPKFQTMLGVYSLLDCALIIIALILIFFFLYDTILLTLELRDIDHT